MSELLQELLEILYESQQEEDLTKIDEAIELVEKHLENPINDYDKDEW